MPFGATSRAALLGAALVLSGVAAAAPPAPVATGLLTGTLAGGGRYILRRTDGAPVVAVALWYRASVSGFSTPPAPGLGRVAAATVAASQPITGTSLEKYVDSVGGRLAVAAYPESIAISVLVPADRAGETIRAMTRSFFAPVVTEAGLGIARNDTEQTADIRGLSPDAAITDQLYARLFAAGPDKSPSFPSTQALAGMSVDGVRSYAERAFRPANAILVVAGPVGPDVFASALSGSTDAAPGTEPPLPEAVTSPVPAPSATTGAEAGFGLGWIGPGIADEREATAMDFIADYLFYEGTGVVQRAVGSTGADLTGTFVTYHDPGVFLITSSGGDEAAARAAVDAALLAIRTPLDAATFAAARRRFVYHILSDSATPQTLADTYGWYSVEGNTDYAPAGPETGGRYFSAASSLTPEFVAATAAKYFGRAGASITITPARSNAPL